MGRVKDLLIHGSSEENEYSVHDILEYRYGIQRPYTISSVEYSNEYPGFEWDHSTVCNHEWLDTGMRRTYCRKCNVRADKDAMTGQITILPPKEKE